MTRSAAAAGILSTFALVGSAMAEDARPTTQPEAQQAASLTQQFTGHDVTMTFGGDYDTQDLADVRTMIEIADCKIKEFWNPEFKNFILLESTGEPRFAISTEGAASIAEELCSKKLAPGI